MIAHEHDTLMDVAAEDYAVEVVRTTARLDAVEEEWRGFLAENSFEYDIGVDPSQFGFDVKSRGEQPFVVLVRRQGVLQCIAPFIEQLAKLPIRFSVFNVASFAVRQAKLCGREFLFAATADARTCIVLIFTTINWSEFDIVSLEAIYTQSPLWEYCAATRVGPSGSRFVRPSRLRDTAFHLELPDSFEAYLATLGSSTRSSLKRRSKKLLADHSATLKVVTAAEQAPAFLEEVDQIFQDSWQAKTYGLASKNNAMELGRLQHLARHGWLRCYLLSSDRGPLAFQYGFMHNDVFHACDFAFAMTWSALGPGAVLMYLMIQDLFNVQTPRLVDLGVGDSPQKHTFRGIPREVADYFLIARKRWRYLLLLQQCLSDVESAARKTLVRLRMDQSVRRFLKRKR